MSVTTAPPVWLLDVDGVLNATRPGWGGPPLTRPIWAYGERWRMRFAPQAVARIRELAGTGLVEVRWATSWADHVGDLARVFDLPGFPAAFVLPEGRPVRDVVEPLKVATALEVVAAGRRLVWTDDDAIPTAGPAREALEAAGALLIAPRPGRGLRPDDLDRVAAYAAGAVAV